MWSYKNFKKSVQGTMPHKILSKTHDFVFSEGVQEAKTAQVMGGKQNSEGPKNARKKMIFACRFVFLIFVAGLLQKCACRGRGKHVSKKHDATQNSHPRGAIAARSALASILWKPQGRAQGDFGPQSGVFSVPLGSQKKPFSNFCLTTTFATMFRMRARSTFL